MSPSLASREQDRRKQIVSVVLLVIILFQLIDLPGAIMSHDAIALGIALLGLALCGLAMAFNHFGRVTVVSILLILVVDLGCGLMLRPLLWAWMWEICLYSMCCSSLYSLPSLFSLR